MANRIDVQNLEIAIVLTAKSSFFFAKIFCKDINIFRCCSFFVERYFKYEYYIFLIAASPRWVILIKLKR